MSVVLQLSLCLLVVLVSCSEAVTPNEVLQEEWETYKLTHGKTYKDKVEELFRKKIFTENKHKIARHNQRFLKGIHKYDLAMNQFGDLLHHEFTATMNGFQRSYRQRFFNGSQYLSPENLNDLPDEVDWRTKGYVTPVKNQGSCGSCWAFSTTGALEGQHMRQTAKLVSLSEQNLVDCSGKFGNEGCNGGLMDQAFEYIKENKGVDTEEAYPYKGVEGKCHYSSSTVGATDTGFMDITSGDEQKLKEVIATIGPVSVAIDASHESFQFYSKGVYDEPECSSTELDHGVLTVGYGTLDDQDFWLVKNSWDTVWGDQGYVRMSRNKQNQCGIATSASYPLV